MSRETLPGERRGPTRSPSGDPAPVARVLRWARVELAPAHRRPSGVMVVVATVVSLVGSLLADEAAVHAATALFPTTRHFAHFQFSDYATLTVVGVLLACAAWPIVTRVTGSPRWLFFRVAVVVTLVLWFPDLWILLQGETAKGVAVLMVMHLAIALVTYNALVHVAPVRAAGEGSRGGPSGTAAPPSASRRLTPRTVRRVWNTMALLVGVELVLGVVTIVSVPFKRSSAIVPSRGTWIYSAHGAVGIALGVGALGVLVASVAADRLARIGAVLGAAGVAAGLAGGVMASFQAARLGGMVVMLLGVIVAGIGYLVPALDEFGRAERARAGVPPGARPGGP
jgi:hypothetical protein